MTQQRQPDDVEKTAWISPCERYRHSLGRHWDRDKGYVLFIGLNPSTADAAKDDPTIRRCIRFARDWGYGGMKMCNLFDWRATKPKNVPRDSFAVSEFNDPMLRVSVAQAGIVIAAWGNVPWADARITEVRRTVFCEEKRWYTLGLLKSGFPRHPLYVPAAAKPVIFW
jgi:hypothetical protein